MKNIEAMEISEGAGVSVYRSIGLSTLKNLDPFLMLDFFGSNDPDDYIAGFPSHPHRGFITFTYMLEGHMLHEDSMGNKGDLVTGGAQWMKAASGVIHSEMPQQAQGTMKGFQLWINLPASEKMSQPEYQEFPPELIPQFQVAGQQVKILSGRYENISGPIKDPLTELHYFDVQLDEQAVFTHILKEGQVGFIFVYNGSVQLDDELVKQKHLLVLKAGEIKIESLDKQSQFLFVSGKPIGESIVQKGPFVMNTNEEIHQAMRDYQNGTLVHKTIPVVPH